MSNNITYPALLQRCRDYYKIPGNECGGSLHIVLDDGNTEPHFIGYCAVYAARHDDTIGEVLALDLLWLTEAQTERLVQELWKRSASV